MKENEKKEIEIKETEVQEEINTKTEETVVVEEEKTEITETGKSNKFNETIQEIEERVKKTDIYTQIKEMFIKIKNNDYLFTLTKRDKLIILGIIIGVFLFDQITKIIASNLLMKSESYEIIDNFFYFTYHENDGMAFSLFEGGRWLFVLGTPMILLLVLYFFVYSKPHEVLTRGGLVLVTAGALGNLVDRIFLGYVRDFIHFYIFNKSFPVFNVADIAVVLGMGLVILEIIIQEYQIWKLSKSL